ncbi:unnamed protein product [Lactuca saligna]|uniref:Pentacotripeptide-repeat region of PRORP domain-containing protein n=1 Tax=Lactuca saligna TaxID=75948 RepID=A0AA35YSP5_LACSI|nr:unnamed protein product [Lactuca saligna]
MLRYTLHATAAARVCSLFNHRLSIHQSKQLRDVSDLSQSELVDRICRLLVLRRFTAISTLSFDFSDDLLNQVLTKLKLNPNACLHFFKLASKQQKFRPHVKSYCRLVHILSRARMFDETRAHLRVLVGFCEEDSRLGLYIWHQLVRFYREFGFSPTVFDIILKLYAEKGLTKNALYVFDEMCRLGRVPSLHSCNGLLSGLVRKKEFHSVFVVYDQMNTIGLVPDVCTCSIIVNAYCKDGKVGRAAEFMREIEEDIGVEPNIVTYNSLINGYVSIGDLISAKGVLRLMNNRHVFKNVVTYTLIIKGYCKQGKMEEAEKLLKDMKKENPSFILDEQAYGVLIDGFCQIGKMNHAVRIQSEMLKAGLKLNLFICNSMINGYYGYFREGFISKAFDLCEKMVHDGIDVNIVTYNTLLKSFCQDNNINKALQLWHLMIKRGVLMLWKQFLAKGFIKPVIGFNIMLNGLCKMGKMDEAEKVFDKMKELGCPPDKITYNTLVDGYCKVGNMEMALEIKDTMDTKSIPLSIEMYNSLITGYFRCGKMKMKRVTDLLGEMHNRGIIPNIVTYGALISGWCKEGKLDKAFTTYSEMKEKGFTPNVIICSTMVSSLYRNGMIDEANMLLHKIMDFDLLPKDKSLEKFFEWDMKKVNFQKVFNIVNGVVESTFLPNNVVYNVAIAGLCKVGKADDAKKFISVLLEKGFVPDNFTYCTLIHALSSNGEVNEAFSLRDEMLTKGLVPDIATYNALINGLCKSGNVDRALRLFYKLRSKGVDPNVITYNILIDGCDKNGKSCEVVKLKEKMVKEGIATSVVTYLSEVREAAS